MMNLAPFTAMTLLTASLAEAHVVVAPQQSQTGASQVYTVRVHNEEKIATTAIELDIPDGVTVVSVAQLPGVTSRTVKSADRVIRLMWNVDIAPGKYVELPFTATNPAAPSQVRWLVRQTMANGSTVDWSEKPGARGKPSTTSIGASPASK